MTTTLGPLSRWSRGGARVLGQRDSSRQIRSRIRECQIRRAMIGAMHEIRHCPPDDWSGDSGADTSAYRSAYELVYRAKEVS